jgi:hypothetical protein
MLRLNLVRLIPRHIVRDLVGISAVASSKGESFIIICIPKPRTPKCRSAQSRAHSIKGQSQLSIQGDTWRAIRLPAFSPIAVSKRKSSSLISPMREVTRASRTWGPQQRRESLGPSDLEDAWRPIEPSRRFAHRNYDKQGSTPSYS